MMLFTKTVQQLPKFDYVQTTKKQTTINKKTSPGPSYIGFETELLFQRQLKPNWRRIVVQTTCSHKS